MGTPLCERLGRSVRLTPCGELLLPQAQAILRQLADARHSVQGLLRKAQPVAHRARRLLRPHEQLVVDGEDSDGDYSTG